MNNNKIKTTFSLLIKLLYYLVIAFACAIIFFLLYYIVVSQIFSNNENYKPKLSIYTIVSPSMTPVINVYDVVVNIRVDDPKEIEIGDIITFKSSSPTSQGMTITHRVIEISQLPDGTYEYMTQGDNNEEPDSSYVLYDSVIGKEILIIPYLGKIQLLVANQKDWLFLLLIPVSIYLFIEIYKLIDLFKLREKVKKVIDKKEDIIDESKIQQELERKEKIIKELSIKELHKESKIKNEKEPPNFLEQYTETKLNVKNNKYATKEKETLKTDIALDDNISVPTKANAKNVIKQVKKESTEIILPKEKNKIINETIEILDTDEFTTKMKEYDSKIEELKSIIKKLEVEENKDIISEESNNIEVDNYLNSPKIKVVTVEETKNKKKTFVPKNKTLNISEQINKSEKEFEDIKLVRKKEISAIQNEKEKLNLNPKEVKKIYRRQRNKNTKETKKLKLNPNNIKKVYRVRKKKNSQSNAPKKGFIIIEKKK